MKIYCPHRLAPLSERKSRTGRVAFVRLPHAWRFDGDGKCTAMPQADNQREEREDQRHVVVREVETDHGKARIDLVLGGGG